MKRYKIGDVAKILGISPDLLRYYEKKGVVRPVKDKTNDYRYYEAWDINFLVDCLWFKNFGFGIEQIAHIVSDSTCDELMQTMEEKQTELREAIHHQQLLLRRAEQYCDGIARARALLGQCDLSPSPETVRYLNRYNFLYDKSPDLQQLGQEWLQYMPFIHRCFEIEREVLIRGGSEYAWGFSLDMDYVREFKVNVEPPVVHLPSEPCLHSVFRSAGKDQFAPRHMDYMVRYCAEHGLRITGNARGNLLCSVLEDGALTGYFEVWLPVSPEADNA